jgi:hypothetical protein
MRSRFVFTLLLILIGALLLSACLSETETPAPDQPAEPEPVEVDEEAYPYPEPVAQPEPDEAYPPPDNIVVMEPYPEGEEGENAVVVNVFLASEFAPLPSDKDLQRGNVFIESTEIVLNNTVPAQAELVIKGNLPTPCHGLRVVTAEPDANGHIELEVYSVIDPDKVCIQVLSPFETTVPLGDFSEGKFTVGINEEEVTKFELP